MNAQPKVYIKGIEKKVIEYISNANHSIIIAMAWFTNNTIKNCLIDKKRNKPEINIEIVVDKNEINKKYFLDYKSKFDEFGILIREKVDEKFLHHKFMIIDEYTAITGSYNFSKKAETNLENIVVIESGFISSYYSRIFKFITTRDYLDENIKLLLIYPVFAKSIISTYYQFNKNDFLKYRDKIQIGECFTHENGMYDEIKYYPGLIFNPKIKYKNDIEAIEFPFPVNKEVIKSWTKNRNMSLILDYYNGKENDYHLINEDLEQNEKTIEEYFKRKMERTYCSEKLKELIGDGIDIILEDDLWINNFEPFLNKQLIERVFENIDEYSFFNPSSSRNFVTPNA